MYMKVKRLSEKKQVSLAGTHFYDNPSILRGKRLRWSAGEVYLIQAALENRKRLVFVSVIRYPILHPAQFPSLPSGHRL
jgi:hypothetical protein